MPGSGTELREFLAQAGLRETGAMDDVAQAARDAATVLEVMTCNRGERERRGGVFTHRSSAVRYGMLCYAMVCYGNGA